MIERLENRHMLAAAVGGSVHYDDGSQSVKIVGTSGDDVISIVRRDNRLIVTLNGVKRTFDRAKVTWIDATTGFGNDVIDAQYTAIRLQALAGSGSDTVVGGWGNDWIEGNDQGDRLIGNAGDDSIDGGGGRDAVFGGDGADELSGGTFVDRVFGDAGEDDIADYDGHDVVDGGADGDWMTRWDLDNDDRLAHTSIEGQTLLHTEKHTDPFVRLQAIKRRDGQFAIVIAATHSSGSFERHFGDLTRNKRTFHADVSGTGGGIGVAMVITELRTYILGRLADGTYTFHAGNDQRRLASITIQISGGQLVNTYTTPTQAMPVVIPFES